jgi:hypothetical protein
MFRKVCKAQRKKLLKQLTNGSGRVSTIDSDSNYENLDPDMLVSSSNEASEQDNTF